MNYSGISECDALNGINFRVVLFVSGCSHECYNCHNPETWDENFGHPFTQDTKNYILECLNKPYIDGITLTGGDPLYSENLDDVLSLIKEIRSKFPSKTIWLYTGYIWDYISTFFFVQNDIKRYKIISLCDVIVDGEYIDKLRDVTLKWRGSSNQRVIDVKKSLEQNKVVLYCD